jgi:hypothetical protein
MRSASTDSTGASPEALRREGPSEQVRHAAEIAPAPRAIGAGASLALSVTARRILIAAAAGTAVAAALGLRLWHLNALGFNSDEAAYAGQAASIAGDQHLSGLFPVFRAHPLLFQLLVSIIYRVHVGELGPRLLSVGFGLAAVVAGYALGARLYGRTAGILTALFLAVMPYLVVVNRQALLDGPMVFFSILALWLLAKFVAEERPAFLYAAGGALGLAFLTKETAILLVPAAYAFLAVTPSVRVKLRDLALSLGCFALVALPYPLSLAIAGGSKTGQHFLVWQLFRPANHTWDFYLSVVPTAMGIPLVVLAVAALVVVALGRTWSWRESLLVSWIVVPAFFFELWPVKGFQYLLPAAAPVAVLAAGLLSGAAAKGLKGLSDWRFWQATRAGIAVAVIVSLGVVSWIDVTTANSTSFLAGTGGVPGGREAGDWIRTHTPLGAEFFSIGPSMANILQFTGQRRVLALSVSPNPLHRNPAYTPVPNPDLLVRGGAVQYIVWDSYSAARTPYFTQRLLSLVRRYHGRVVHVQTVPVQAGGQSVQRPVIVIYEVRS